MRLKTLSEFSQHDAEAVRLVLRGGSVIDWHRLNLPTPEAAERFIRMHELDPGSESDRAFMEGVKVKAIQYLRRNFSFAIPKPVEDAPITELLQLATGSGHRQQCACAILKVIHIVNHMAARELLFRLPVSDRDVFQLVEEKIYRSVGVMLNEGFPIKEFVGGRKNPDSTYSKLLSKETTSTSAIYDKLRFRLITQDRSDVLPVIHYLTECLFPFNYIVPGESTNTMIDFQRVCDEEPNLREMVAKFQGKLDPEIHPGDNRFSDPTYKTVQFVTEVPVRVPAHIMDLAPPGSEEFGPIVYVLCEIQIMDAVTERANEGGAANHTAYKTRQREAVFRRLRLGSREQKDPKAEGA